MYKLIIFCLLLFSFQLRQKTINFPRESTILKSPNQNYFVYNENYDSADHNHALFLKNMKTNKVIKLQDYDRNVDVTWSPDSKYIAVTDNVGSNFSNVYLYEISKSNYAVKTINISDELKKHYGSNKHIFENHHVYIKFGRWINAVSLLINIDGYGEIDPQGFKRSYIYNVKNNSVKPKK